MLQPGGNDVAKQEIENLLELFNLGVLLLMIIIVHFHHHLPY